MSAEEGGGKELDHRLIYRVLANIVKNFRS